ncbi:unnamed protein product [Aureobasidium pullulans]|nr:unnamed protein product [Aureobasidium pullulans]
MPSINITPAEVRNLRAVLQHGAIDWPAVTTSLGLQTERSGKDTFVRFLKKATEATNSPARKAATTTTTAPKAKRAKAQKTKAKKPEVKKDEAKTIKVKMAKSTKVTDDPDA